MMADEIKRVSKAPSVSCSISRKISDGNYGHIEAQVHISSGTTDSLKSQGTKKAKIEELMDEIAPKLDERLAKELLKHYKMEEKENVVDDALRHLKAGNEDEALSMLEDYVSGDME